MLSKSVSDQTQESFDLQPLWSCLRRRWLAVAIISTSVFGLTGLMVSRPVYEAQGKLLLSKQDRVSSLTDLTDQVREINGLANSTNPLDTEAEIIKSPPLVARTIDTLNLQDSKGRPLTIDQFLGQFRIRAIRGTDVLLLSYQGKDPQESIAVVNLLMDYYLENNVQVNRSEAVAAREFIRKQLPDVEARVIAAEAELKQFKESNRIVSLDEESRITVQDLSYLSREITEASAELADVNSQTETLQRQIGLNPSQAITSTSLSQSNAIQQVLTEYQAVQNQLALQRVRYQPLSPIIIALEKKEAALGEQLRLRINQAVSADQPVSERDLQLSQLKQDLAETLVKAEAERSGLVNRVSVLNQAIANYQTRASLLPQLEQRQRQLERRLQVAQLTYEQLLKRLQEVEVAENQNVGSARIVEPARMPQQRFLRRFVLLALGGVAGITIGVVVALVLDTIDKSVKTVEEAQKLAGYPLLAVIPLVDSTSTQRLLVSDISLPVLDNPHSSISTNFEMLQTTLGFTMSSRPLKVILVASAVSGEGKSFIAANLAAATAQMGRRVLLIDADMRYSVQHRIWQQINLKGLSDILVEQANFSDTVKQIRPNLDVLTSGTLPPNPVALIDSQRFASLIESAMQDYDFIILDTPALTLAPDGLTLSKFVDGSLFVVRPNAVDSAAVKQATALLAQTGQNVLGMVVNGWPLEQKYTPPYYGNRSMASSTSDVTDSVHLRSPE